MSDYDRVEMSLKSGADPALLCATCPWDRQCVKAPELTQEDIDRKVKEAGDKDIARSKDQKDSFPFGTLITSMMYAGRARTGEICPVLALMLRSSDGRRVSDGLRALMQEQVRV